MGPQAPVRCGEAVVTVSYKRVSIARGPNRRPSLRRTMQTSKDSDVCRGPAALRGPPQPPSDSAPAAGCHRSSSRSWSVRAREGAAVRPSQEGDPLPPSPRARPGRQGHPCRGTGPRPRPQSGEAWTMCTAPPYPAGIDHPLPGPRPLRPGPAPSHLQEAGVVVFQSGPDVRCQEWGQRLRGAQEIRTGRQGGA